MFRRTNHGWIGLDIGASTIKLAQMVRRGGRLQLEEAAVIPRAQPWREMGLVGTAAVSAAEEIDAALASAPQLHGRRAAAILPTSACDYSTASLEEKSEASQVATIAEELASLGVHLQHRVFDYWPGVRTRRGVAGRRDQVNVLSTSRAWSNLLTSDLSRAGLSCQTIDGLPFALCRAIAQQYSSIHTATLAAVDWGYSGALFVLMDRARPIYVRQLKNTALANALAKVATELDLQSYEVVDLFRSLDLRSTGNEVAQLVAELLAPFMEALAAEIERTLEHLRSAGSALDPQKIFLFGGGGTLIGMDALLTRRLNRAVEVWRLDAESEQIAGSKDIPTCLLGPAIALSALQWETQA